MRKVIITAITLLALPTVGMAANFGSIFGALTTANTVGKGNATFGGSAASQGIEIVEIHPADAAKNGLNDGDKVTIWNKLAEVTLQVVISDTTRQGVLYSPKGTWRATSETGLTVNALISADTRTDIEDGACYNETFVDVKKC